MGGITLKTTPVPVRGPHVGGNEECVQCQNGGRQMRVEHRGRITAVNRPQCG